jgi:hypothetical protein
VDPGSAGGGRNCTDITAHAETESVVLRDPAGKRVRQILEQNYRADPVSQELLLSLSEGKILDFLVKSPQGEEKVVQGKVIRSGYVPHPAAYNLVEAGEKDRLDLTGWVTIDNQSGKDFAEARVKLMAPVTPSTWLANASGRTTRWTTTRSGWMSPSGSRCPTTRPRPPRSA